MADVVELQFQWPPVEKMDATLGTLTECWKLSLSTNCIGAINGLANMKKLRVLGLSRNYIKSLMGLEVVGDTLEELWISYNQIDKTRGISALRKLKVLYMAHNLVKDWPEFTRLQDCPLLDDVIFLGNPLMEAMEETDWRRAAVKKLPQLKTLDGEPIIVEFEEQPPPPPPAQPEGGDQGNVAGEQPPTEEPA
ncbi:hypothetical protein AAG570_002157 [Ranatra chinensis]|uniref:Dynein axonemal light chain 1 n=1 Tax=Ranatra chinensis TaxID=642074 RepID=A0ABD0Y7Q8_9HEMI